MVTNKFTEIIRCHTIAANQTTLKVISFYIPYKSMFPIKDLKVLTIKLNK